MHVCACACARVLACMYAAKTSSSSHHHTLPQTLNHPQEGRELRRARRRLAASAEAVYDLLHARWPPARWPSGPPDEERSLAACLMRMVDRNGRKPARGAVVAEICDSLTASETIPSTVMWTL